MYAAFTVSALMGLAIFFIWWFTAERRAPKEEPPPAAASKPSAEEIIEARLPRGGSLTGTTDDVALATEWLTGAPLVRVNRSTDQLEPWLAESWTASPDNLIYTVKLRPGLTSADGRPLTAEEAAKSLAGLDKPVSVRPIDPLTLEIRFAAPFAPALRVLDRRPIEGFGPFVREKTAFKRNPHYWRKAADGSPLPYLDEIVLTEARLTAGVSEDFRDAPIAADEFEAVKKLEQSGKLRIFELGPGLDVDALWIVRPLEVADVSRRSGGAARLRQGSGAAGMGDRPWLFDDRFRLAISAAVDRRQYCKQVFYGACDPIVTPVSPANVAWFNPDLPLGPGNPQLARAMLAELGLRDRTGDGLLDDATRRPLRFTLLIRRDVASSARAARFLADALTGIGVRMDVEPVDAKTLAARRAKGNYDAIYDRIEMRDTDPAMNLEFWTGESVDPAPWQRQMRELMLKNAASFDRIERLQTFVDAQKIYLQHMPAIVFGVPHIRVATSMRTLNATPSPLRPHILWNAEHLAALQ